MKNYLLHLFLILLFFACLNTTAQNIQLIQSHKNGIYKTGDTVQIKVLLKNFDTDSIKIKIRKNNSKEPETKIFSYLDDTLLIFNEIIKGPASLIIEVNAGKQFASTGALVDPEKFKPGTKRPRKIDKFWNKEKETLSSNPVQVNARLQGNVETGYACADVEINIPGSKPATGYFAKPLNAKPKSLPIVLFLRAAGVKGSWCISKPGEALRWAKMGNGALAFDLNAHGMQNGQPQKYYDELEAGALKNYWEIGIEDRNQYYFKGMYLRLMQTLNFLTIQPEWDGKRIIVIGESQGGGQALAAAGLDKRVTAVVATVPAMCDFGNELKGGTGGWPNPFRSGYKRGKMKKTVPYFDTAHLLKNSYATIVVEIGFVDTTCPASTIYAAINQSKGKKIIYNVPYRGHQLDQEQFRQEWEANVNRQKKSFIDEFLK